MASAVNHVVLQITTKNNTFIKFLIVMILSILPLALVKILQSSWLGGHQIHFHEHKLIEFVGFLGISYVTFKSTTYNGN